MRVYLRYALKETVTNLWRNRLMTIAAVLTVAVSLSPGGRGAAPQAERRPGLGQWQQGTRVTVWMEPTASPAEIANVQHQLWPACRSSRRACTTPRPRTTTRPRSSCRPTSSDVLTRRRHALVVPLRADGAQPTPSRSSRPFSRQPGVYTGDRARAADPPDEPGDPRSCRSSSWSLALVLLLSAGGADPQHHPHGDLRAATRGVGDEARRRDELVHPRALHHRGLHPGAAAARAWRCSAVTGAAHLVPAAQRVRSSTRRALWGTNAWSCSSVGVVIGSVGSAIAIRRFLDV